MVKNNAFQYDFTMRELFYFPFAKKICSKCGGIMDKKKDYEIGKGSDFNNSQKAFFVPNAKVKHYIYSFSCKQCGSQYKLKELVKKEIIKIVCKTKENRGINYYGMVSKFNKKNI